MYRLIVPNKSMGDAAVTGFYMSIIQKGFQKAGKECQITRLDFKGNKNNDVLLLDEAILAYKIIRKGYKNIVFWSQGVVPEESFMRNQSKLRFWALSRIERIVLKKAKMLLLCSETMLKHYEDKYKLCLSDKAVIMPCFNENGINESAFNQPEKYKKNTFLYVGSLKKWQCFEQTVQIYKRIEETSPIPVELFVYTEHQNEAKNMLERCNVNHFLVSYAKPNELAEKIKGMKYGFVIREDNVVNNVATPTKFSNYISNGIIPIYSSCLRDFFEEDQKRKFGIICDLNNVGKGVTSIQSHMKKVLLPNDIENECRMWFDTYYNVDKYVSKISKKIAELRA